jgi:hypothetical protein
VLKTDKFHLDPMGGLASSILKSVGTSMLIIKVCPHSPAHDLGIRAGWLLDNIDLKPPHAILVREAQLGGAKSIMVGNPERHVFEVRLDGRWPFGMTVVDLPGMRLKRSISTGMVDLETLSLYWKEQVDWVYADLHDALEAHLSAPHVGIVARKLGRKATPEQIAQSDNFVCLLFLALAKLCRGDKPGAQFMLEAALASRDRSGQTSHSTVIQSLEHHVAARLLAATDPARALSAAHTALELAPEIPTNKVLVEALMGSSLPEQLPQFVLQPLPFDYDLPARDPIGEVASNLDRVRLADALKILKPGQVIVILLMSNFRSNYYYNLDLERLALLNRAYPGGISEVHVIVAGDYALDAQHRQQAEGVAKQLGLPFAILHDPDDRCAAGLGLTGFPARFVVDKNRTVLATERFMEEDGFWLALARARLVQGV